MGSNADMNRCPPSAGVRCPLLPDDHASHLAAPSNTVCTTRPIAPSGLSVAAVDVETLELTWVDNSSVDESYEVWFMGAQWSCGNGHSGIFEYEIRLAVLTPNTTSHRTAGVLGEDACATTTWFEVRAMKDGSYTATAYTIDPP